MEDISNVAISASDERKAKKYLIGGSGWMRRSTMIEQEGRRYMPKGGHIVDFSSRDPLLWRIAANNERNGTFANPSNATASTISQQKVVPQSTATSTNTSWAEKVVLRHTHGTLSCISSSPEVSPHLKNGVKGGGGGPAGVLEQRPEDSSEKQHYHEKFASEINLKHQDNAGNKQQWRPPGPCSPPRGSRPPSLNLRHQYRRGLAGTAAGTGGGGGGLLRTKKKGKVHPPHNCEDCECCQSVRQDLQTAEAAARQDRAAAGHLRRRLEADMAKLAKDQHDFEEYKVI